MFNLSMYVEGVSVTYELLTRATRLVPRVVALIAELAAEEARPVTHVITGALQASHKAYKRDRLRWDVMPDPTVINPLGDRPTKYGPVEHARGGSHAFYDRTILERSRIMLFKANAYIEQELT